MVDGLGSVVHVNHSDNNVR